MKTKHLYILIISLIIFQVVASGQEVQEYLNKVRENNPEIHAYRKLLDARKYEARTGITPPGPSFSYGFMPGTTETTGTKKTWSVMQSFSFPTKYILQKKISRNTLALAEQEFKLGTLNTMIKAKLMLYEFFYDQRVLEVLLKRKELYDTLKTAWEKLLSNGGATVLEYNKILLELSSLNLRIRSLQSDIGVLNERLGYMTGNSAPPPVAEYVIQEIKDPDALISEKSTLHPAFLLPEMEYQTSLQEVKLSRAGSLPELQAGVASEIIPGETYTGPVAGLTLPLWANSYKVKAAESRAEHSAALRDAELLNLKSAIRGEYEKMTALGKSLTEVREIMASTGNREFTDKALSAGEISLTDYFIYLETSFQAEDKFYELEFEYNKSLATLYDLDLLN